MVFETVDVKIIFILLLIGLFVAYFFSKMPLLDQHPVSFLFFFSFFISIPFWGASETLIDSSRYFIYAKYVEQYGIWAFMREWGSAINIWVDLPAVPLLYGIIFRFIGESRIYLQIFTTLLFSVTVVFTYIIGRKLWNTSVGTLGSFLLLGIPYLPTQVPSMLVDVPTMFFFTLAILAFINAVGSDDMRWSILASAALFITFFSKFSTWGMLLVLLVILLLQMKKDERRTVLYRGMVIAVISGALIGFVVFSKYDVLLGQLALLQSYQFARMEIWSESYSSIFLFQIHPFITLAALYSIFIAIQKKDLKYLIISWPFILFIVNDVGRIRYILPAFPMLALMASYGLNEIGNENEKKFLACGIVVSSLVISMFAYLPFVETLSPVNLKNAGEYVNALDVDGIEVFTIVPPGTVYNPAIAVPLLDLFTDKKIYYNPEYILPPPNASIEYSWARFTWEYQNPEYYGYDPNTIVGKKAIVIIYRDVNEDKPDYLEKRLAGYRLSKVFDTVSSRLFIYRTLVEVYIPSSDLPSY